MCGIDPGCRHLAMVFQNYALYPTMSVRENIEFGLKNMKVPRQEREIRIAESLKMVKLEQFADRRPKNLSGGQCQRVALARAIVKKPRLFLMDEPLSNLDAKLRAQIRADLIEIHRKLNATFVYVTHDQVEAMSMGTEIILLEDGRIRQQDSPAELYNGPKNLFTAQFIGSPPMNILDREFFSEQGISVPPDAARIGFRPEKAETAGAHGCVSKDTAFFPGELVTREMLGDQILYKVKIDAGYIYAKTTNPKICEYGSVVVTVEKKYLHYFDAQGNRVVYLHEPASRTRIPGGSISRSTMAG
jgi:sn-glycerol 3-phosphate transport system ATP-binding protein